MTTQPNIKYRDPEAERAIVQILADGEARQSFLRDRSGFLAQYQIGPEAKAALAQVPEQEIADTARDFEVRGYLVTLRTSVKDGTGSTTPTSPCAYTTFGDFFCDGST